MEIIDNFKKGGQYGRKKTNGVSENKHMDYNPKYLEDLDREILARKEKAEKRKLIIDENYKVWVSNNNNIKLASNHTIVNPGYVLIEVFFYVEKPETSIILEGIGDECFYKTLPIAKVLNTSISEILNTGDIVTISPLMSKNVLNEEWVKYQSTIREQPTMRNVLVEPPVFVGRLTEWMPYMYQLNSLEETTIFDQHIYCLPERYIQGKLNEV